jgi:hypothetical protein
VTRKMPPLPNIICPDGHELVYNTMSNGWECALPNSTPHYLADKQKWIMCPADWVFSQDPVTGAFQWVPPPKPKPANPFG